MNNFFRIVVLCLGVTLFAQQPAREKILAFNEVIRSHSMERDKAGLRRLADERAALLEQVLRTQPGAVPRFVLALEDAARLREMLTLPAEALEEISTWEGELQITVMDDFEHGRSKTQWAVSIEGSLYELFFTDDKKPAGTIRGGTRVQVQGIRVGKSIALQQNLVMATSIAGCSTTGTENVAYIMAQMPGGTAFPAAFTAAAIRQAAFAPTGVSLNTYWQDASYGLTSATGDVFGPFTLPASYTCDQSSLLETAAFNTAAANGVDLSGYSHVAIIFPTPPACGYGGLGTLGCQTLPNSRIGSFAWFPITSYQGLSTFPGILAHEHGHNLGLGHSSSEDHGSSPLSALNDTGTAAEYGDPFSVMGMSQQSQGGVGIVGQYSAEHKSIFLNWLTSGAGFREVTQTGIYSVVPFELASGVRALRILRDALTGAWLWLEYRQPLGPIDSTLTRLATTVMSGASIRYEGPNLESTHTALLDFTPSGTPNNFLDAPLASGQSWTDPATPLRIQVMSATANGLTVAVNYDASCAVLSASQFTMPAAGGGITLSIAAPAGCAWTASTTDTWLTFGSAASGSGNGTVTVSGLANPGTTQRQGYVTINRQSAAILQPPALGTYFSAQPSKGAGLSATIAFNFTDTKPNGYLDISRVNVRFAGDPGCQIDVMRSSRYAFLLNDTGTTYDPLNLAIASATVSNSQCTVYSSGSSLTGSGQQMTLTLHVVFNSAFAGTRTFYVSASDASGTTFGPFSAGGWTVPYPVATERVGFFQPSGPTWVLDANGSGAFEGAAGGDRYFSFAGQAGAVAVVGDWNGDGRSKVGYYLNGFWALDYNGNGAWDGVAGGDKFYAFGGGDPSYVPVVGDWNGDGRTKIGYYRNGFWALDLNGNGQYDGVAAGQDGFFGFGGNGAGEVLVVGDWNGDKRTKIGVYFQGKWVLDYDGNGMFTAADKYYTGFVYGAGDKPVAGDWSGDGKTKIGVYRSGFWVLDYNGNGSYDGIGAGADKFYGFGGTAGEVPLVADWSGNGTSKIGVYTDGFWVLDYNGNGTYDGATSDRFIAFGGGKGSQPLVGHW